LGSRPGASRGGSSATASAEPGVGSLGRSPKGANGGGADAVALADELARVRDDLRELWRRLVFSLLASNYDDHLRNHGFLMHSPGRWALSPAYDLNPIPEIDRTLTPKTPIAEDRDEVSIAATIEVAPRFGIKAREAKAILREVLAAVSGWRKTGRGLRIKASTLDAYSTAFEHPLIEEARELSQ